MECPGMCGSEAFHLLAKPCKQLPGLQPHHPPTHSQATGRLHHAPGSLVAGPSSPSRCRICTLRYVNSQSCGEQGRGVASQSQ